MNKKIYSLIIVIIVLLLTTYYVYTKNSRTKVLSTSPNISLSSGPHTIILKNSGLTFELPPGFAAYVREGFGGGYGATISISEEVSPGHFAYAGIDISIDENGYDEITKKMYTAEEYVVASYEKNVLYSPQYTSLFGNKAFRSFNDADSTPYVIGYLKANQSGLETEHIVSIYGDSYHTGISFNQNLFDMILNSIKVVNK